MNKTKVMISGERQKVRQKASDGHVGFAVKVLVAIHYSVLAARNGYTRNLMKILSTFTYYVWKLKKYLTSQNKTWHSCTTTALLTAENSNTKGNAPQGGYWRQCLQHQFAYVVSRPSLSGFVHLPWFHLHSQSQRTKLGHICPHVCTHSQSNCVKSC